MFDFLRSMPSSFPKFRPHVEELQHRWCPSTLVVNGTEVIYTADVNETNHTTFGYVVMIDILGNPTFNFWVTDPNITIVYNGQNYNGEVTLWNFLPTKIFAYLEDGNDKLENGTDIDFYAEGGTGNDTMDGGAAKDEFWGEEGIDFLSGWDGYDTLHGGDNIDVISGGAGNDDLFGDGGDDSLYGDGDYDELHGGDNDDVLFGGSEGDDLYGDDGKDILQGDGGIDELWGGDKDDKLYGGLGVDTLHGGDGNDICYGGDLAFGDDALDVIRGDADKDTFWTAEQQNDEVKDYTPGAPQFDVLV